MAAAADVYGLAIASAHHAAGDALVLTFDVPSGMTKTFEFKPGQHVALSADVGGEELRRNYSICSATGEPLRVAIKRVDDGRFSSWAHRSVRAGMTIGVMPPSGRFVLEPAGDRARHIVLLAAGSGITPCLGIAREALLHEPGTRVTLVYGNRGRDTTMFADELEALKDTHLGRFELIHLLSRDGEAEIELLSGRITAEKLRALSGRVIDFKRAERIFVCGPGAMIKDVRDALLEMGVVRDAIRHEFFAAGTGPRRATIAKPVAVSTDFAATTEATAILDDVRHRLALRPGETILAAALRAGLKPPYSCQGGMCATCRARVTDGSVEMLLNYSLEPWEIERGFVLTCQAVPKSARFTVDWDAM